MINTSYIQGITRGYSYLRLFGTKGLPKAIGVNILTVVLFVIAYLIANFVFTTPRQMILFFVACVGLSTFVAITDNQFQVAVKKTKSLEN